MRPLRALLMCGLFWAAAGLVWGQALPLEPVHEAGASITGAFEGWFHYPDGSFGLLLGYFNRNQKQELDIPIGPDNRIEPDGPDRGQPTHFYPGRKWGMFTIKVPADFGENKITWTIVANGQTTVIPASLKPDYEVEPFEEAAVHNTPPVIGLEEGGPTVQGPTGMTVHRMAKVGVPLTLTVWATDDAKLTTSSGAAPRTIGPPVILTWTKYRGPGTVAFSASRPALEKTQKAGVPYSAKGSTTATFSTPGDYTLAVQATDYSGEGGNGFQCCWTTAHVEVAVQP